MRFRRSKVCCRFAQYRRRLRVDLGHTMRLIAPYWLGMGVILACHAPMVSAELWGFVDEAGVAHFSTQRIDDRYELFFKGATNLDADRARAQNDNAKVALARTPLYRRVAAHPNAGKFAGLIERNAHAHAIDPALVNAVIAVESAFEPHAISPKGARGLMQVMLATAVRYGLV